MQFQLEIAGHVFTFTHTQELLDELNIQIAYWNNFHADTPLVATICKIETEDETLGVHVEEEISAEDIFGRR